MASLVTLGSLVARARKLAKMENSLFVTDAELRQLLLSSIKRIRHRLQGHGQEYDALTKEMDTIVGQSLYDMPVDYYRLLLLLANPVAVQVARVGAGPGDDGGTWNDPTSDAPGWLPLRPFEHREKVNLLNRRDGSAWNARYRLRGKQVMGDSAPVRQIEIMPVPRVPYTLRLEYLPVTTALDNEEFQIETLDGFEDIAVFEAVVLMLQMEESDASWAEGWLLKKETELDEVAPAQDVTHADRIVNVYEGEGELGRLLPHQGWYPPGWTGP